MEEKRKCAFCGADMEPSTADDGTREFPIFECFECGAVFIPKAVE